MGTSCVLLLCTSEWTSWCPGTESWRCFLRRGHLGPHCVCCTHRCGLPLMGSLQSAGNRGSVPSEAMGVPQNWRGLAVDHWKSLLSMERQWDFKFQGNFRFSKIFNLGGLLGADYKLSDTIILDPSAWLQKTYQGWTCKRRKLCFIF